MQKRVLACLLALAMMLTLLPVGVMAQEPSVGIPAGYGRSVLARMNNAEALLYVYDTIEEKLDTATGSIEVKHQTYKVTWDELCTVYNLVLSDHPEVFWHDTRYSGGISPDGYAVVLTPTYLMSGSALKTARAELEAEVTRLTADLDGKSDYEKSRILHDRLAAETVYVQQGLHQTAYGALVQDAAVCAGYAHAYELLMKRVGIPTWYITGDSVNPSGTVVPHAWNLVQLDGEWYYTDVTWDDQGENTFYAYLNVTTDQITEDHSFGDYSEYLPVANGTQDNYFVIYDLQREKYDIDTVVHILRDFSVARVYITGDKKAFLNELSAHLWDVMEALHAPPGAVSYKYSSLGHEVILKVTMEHECQYALQRVEPTCREDGYSVEICSYEFCHNEQNRITLPAVGEHVYDSACDADCNLCGAVREIEGHRYSYSCSAYCDYCGAERETEGHVYDYPCSTRCRECGALRPDEAMHEHQETVITPATCGKEGLSRFACIYCGDGFTMITPMTLQHVYDNDCDKECNVCYRMRPVQGHTYDNDCDTDCNSCGHIRGVGDHVYDTVCDSDCNSCGALREDIHVYDDEEDTECNECGAVREIATHTPGDLNGDGEVNVRDLGLLQQYLNEYDVIINEAAADVTGDGEVNVRDYGLLQQYLNDWEVTLK